MLIIMYLYPVGVSVPLQWRNSNTRAACGIHYANPLINSYDDASMDTNRPEEGKHNRAINWL